MQSSSVGKYTTPKWVSRARHKSFFLVQPRFVNVGAVQVLENQRLPGARAKKKKTAAIESSDFGFKYSSLEKKQFCPGGKEKNQPSHCDCRCCCCWLAGRLTMDFVVAGNEVGAEEKTSRDFRVETLDGASDKEGRARRKCLGSHAPIQRFTTLPLPGMETINTDDNETCSLPMVPKDVSVGRQRPNGVAHPNKMPLFHSTRWKNWRSESSENVDTPSTIDAARR